MIINAAITKGLVVLIHADTDGILTVIATMPAVHINCIHNKA